MQENSRVSRSLVRILLLLLVGGSLAIAVAACGATDEAASSNEDAQPVESGAADPLEEARAELAELAAKIRVILDAFKAENPENELIKKIEGYLGVLEEQPIVTAEEAEATSVPEEELRSDPPDPSSIPEPVLRYAPVVYFHPNEWLYPIDADLFLAQSTLMWAHADCDANAIAAGARVADEGLPPLDADQLGTGGYSHPAGCAGEGSTYDSNELTRPGETGEERPNDLPLTEGFFLELDDAYRFGDPIAATTGKPDGIPIYFEYEPNRFVTYWILYGASASPVPDPQFYAEATILAHEGDWEHISVRLNERDEATHVFYASHAEGQELAWAEVPKEEETHPVVYSAWGSHASNPETGVFELDCPFSDACFYDFVESSGTGWQTWEHVRPAREEPWYGFGGAWGTNWPTKKLSGALGPSTYKEPAPEGW